MNGTIIPIFIFELFVKGVYGWLTMIIGLLSDGPDVSLISSHSNCNLCWCG